MLSVAVGGEQEKERRRQRSGALAAEPNGGNAFVISEEAMQTYHGVYVMFFFPFSLSFSSVHILFLGNGI